MVEGKGVAVDDDDPEVVKIALRTAHLIETRRKKEEAKRMARLIRNFNMEQLRNGTANEEPVEEEIELMLEEEEAERLRILQGMQQELADGVLLTQEPISNNKYESPLVVQLRQVETVKELYSLADKIIPLTLKQE